MPHDDHRISLLYVEDEQDTRERIGPLIMNVFPLIDVYTADNGRNGLALFREKKPDIVFTDISMPVMTGIEMVNEIRSLDTAVQIIFITAHNDSTHLMDAIKMGVTHYLQKPIDFDRLFEIIAQSVSRINIERQLRRQDEFIRKLGRAVECSPSTIIITDASGTIEYVNPKFTQITGYEPEEAIGQNPRILKSGSVAADVYQNLWASITSGVEWRGEFLNRKKNGDFYWEAASISPIQNGSGAITHFVAVKEDITEKKRMEAELRESEARYRSFFENSIDGVLIAALDGTIVDANPSACAMFGHTVDELRRVGWRGIFEGLQLAEMMQEKSRAHGYRGELEAMRASGASFRVEVSLSDYHDRNGCSFTSIIVRDVTERKRAEQEIEMLNTNLAARAIELESANRDLEAFNSMVSHDLRRPLTAINGFCQVIMELHGNSLNTQCVEIMKDIYNATLQMNKLINTLLDFSRLNHREIRPDTVNLSRMAQVILAELRFMNPGRKVGAEVEEGIMVRGDLNLLHVVLENLIGNAWKYTSKKDSPNIRIGSTLIGGMPAIFIRDNGAGFDNGSAEKIFTPFHRLHGSEDFEGTGIGLATVHRIITRHGGRVWAEGKVGEGATFYLTLP